MATMHHPTWQTGVVKPYGTIVPHGMLQKTIDEFIYKNAGRNWQDPDSNASWDLRDDLQALFPAMTEQDIYEIYRLASQNS